MEEFSTANTIAATAPCGACFTHVNEYDAFCQRCGYPLKGTEEEQGSFISNRNSKEIDLEDANKKIKTAG